MGRVGRRCPFCGFEVSFIVASLSRVLAFASLVRAGLALVAKAPVASLQDSITCAPSCTKWAW